MMKQYGNGSRERKREWKNTRQLLSGRMEPGHPHDSFEARRKHKFAHLFAHLEVRNGNKGRKRMLHNVQLCSISSPCLTMSLLLASTDDGRVLRT